MKSSATNPCRYITEPKKLILVTLLHALATNVKYRRFILNSDKRRFCVVLPTLDTGFLTFVVARNRTLFVGSLRPLISHIVCYWFVQQYPTLNWMRIWNTGFGSVPHHGEWGRSVWRKRRFFLLSCINNQYLPNTGNTLLSRSLLAHSLAASPLPPSTAPRRVLTGGSARAAAAAWLPASLSLFLLRACRLGLGCAGTFLSPSRKLLSWLTRLSQCCQQRIL